MTYKGKGGKMNEDRIDISKCICDLGILLDEVMHQALHTNYAEKYQNHTFADDEIIMFDCMCDDVSRIARVIDLHDALAQANKDDLMFAMYGDVDNLFLVGLLEEDLIRLQKNIENELNKDRGY